MNTLRLITNVVHCRASRSHISDSASIPTQPKKEKEHNPVDDFALRDVQRCEITTVPSTVLHCVPKSPPFYCSNNSSKINRLNDFFGFPKVKWLQIRCHLRWANVPAINVKFSKDLTHQKSLNRLIFDTVI